MKSPMCSLLVPFVLAVLTACQNTVPPTVAPTPTTALVTTPWPSSPTIVPNSPTRLPTIPATLIGSAYARVEAVIPVKGIPFGLALSGDSLWVLQRYEPFTGPGSVLRIDLATNQIVGAPIQLDFDPWSIAATPDSVWVAKNGPAAVAHIDPKTQHIVATIDIDASIVAADLQGVLVSGAGENSKNANTASRVDPLTNRVVGALVPVGNEPLQLVAGAGSVWVGAHSGPPAITRIDPATGKVLATIEVGFGIHGLAAGSNSVWAADSHEGKIVQISPLTNQIIGEPIPLPFSPYAIAVSMTDAWVGASAIDNHAAAGPNLIVRIDPRTNTIVDTLDIGGKVYAMLVDDQGALWVAVDKPYQIVKLMPRPLPTPTPK